MYLKTNVFSYTYTDTKGSKSTTFWSDKNEEKTDFNHLNNDNLKKVLKNLGRVDGTIAEFNKDSDMERNTRFINLATELNVGRKITIEDHLKNTATISLVKKPDGQLGFILQYKDKSFEIPLMYELVANEFNLENESGVMQVNDFCM